MTNIEVTLGEHTVPVYPQRHAYLTNKLSKQVQELISGNREITADSLVSQLGSGAYDVLVAMIPTLGKRMPKWEFQGYGSAEAAAAGEYSEEEDKSPTVPEILNAFEKAAEVNRFDALKAIGKILDPKMLRQMINAKLAEEILRRSPNSPSANGGSDQMSSGTTAPTSTASAD